MRRTFPSTPRLLVLALLLATSGAAGCGARTNPLIADPIDEDAATDTPSLQDAGADAGDATFDADETIVGGFCHFHDVDLACAAGKVCTANFVVGPTPTVCISTRDPAEACGLIGCGELCTCVDSTRSLCDCR